MNPIRGIESQISFITMNFRYFWGIPSGELKDPKVTLPVFGEEEGYTALLLLTYEASGYSNPCYPDHRCDLLNYVLIVKDGKPCGIAVESDTASWTEALPAEPVAEKISDIDIGEELLKELFELERIDEEHPERALILTLVDIMREVLKRYSPPVMMKEHYTPSSRTWQVGGRDTIFMDEGVQLFIDGEEKKATVIYINGVITHIFTKS